MKFLFCLCFYVWMVGVAVAQQPGASLPFIHDAEMRREFSDMCRRHVALKLSAAERLGLDTLPEFKSSMEDYRQWVASRLAHSTIGCVDSTSMLQVKFCQIVKYLPQNITSTALRKVEQQMDSISQALQYGASFETCMKHYSDRIDTVWVTYLEVPMEMEKQLAALNVGEISKPFFSAAGLHMVRVLERREVPVVKKNLAQSVFAVGCEEPGKEWIDSLKKLHQFVPNQQGIDELLKYSHTKRTLFTLKGKSYTGEDFDVYALAYPAGVQKQYLRFLHKCLMDMSYEYLEEIYPHTASMLRAYRDSLLVQDVTIRQLLQEGAGSEEWLQAYFEQHRSAYRRKTTRYHGVVIQAATKHHAKQVKKLLKKLPVDEWKEAIRLIFSNGEHPEVNVVAGNFALGDHPWVDEKVFKTGHAVPSETYPVVWVLGKKVKQPLGWQEVRQTVIRDAFEHWERQWIGRLEQE